MQIRGLNECEAMVFVFFIFLLFKAKFSESLDSFFISAARQLYLHSFRNNIISYLLSIYIFIYLNKNCVLTKKTISAPHIKNTP